MSKRIAALVAVILSGAAQASDSPQDTLRFLSAGDLRAGVAKTTDGLAAMPVPTGPGAVVLFAHRTRPGEAEVHMKLNDELIVQSGKAAILVGGRVEGNREVSPGEWRGGTISGARRYGLAPGDALWIPAGVAHQMIVPDGGSISYFAVKFTAEGQPQR